MNGQDTPSRLQFSLREVGVFVGVASIFLAIGAVVVPQGSAGQLRLFLVWSVATVGFAAGWLLARWQVIRGRRHAGETGYPLPLLRRGVVLALEVGIWIFILTIVPFALCYFGLTLLFLWHWSLHVLHALLWYICAYWLAQFADASTIYVGQAGYVRSRRFTPWHRVAGCDWIGGLEPILVLHDKYSTYRLWARVPAEQRAEIDEFLAERLGGRIRS